MRRRRLLRKESMLAKELSLRTRNFIWTNLTEKAWPEGVAWKGSSGKALSQLAWKGMPGKALGRVLRETHAAFVLRLRIRDCALHLLHHLKFSAHAGLA